MSGFPMDGIVSVPNLPAPSGPAPGAQAPIVVLDDHELCDQRLDAAEKRAGELAADLLEERAQRRDLAAALVRVTEERDDWKTLERLTRAERDEARDEVAKRDVEIERLRTIIQELGAGEAAEPPEPVGGLCVVESGFAHCIVTDPNHRRIYHGGRPAPPEGIEALRPGGAE